MGWTNDLKCHYRYCLCASVPHRWLHLEQEFNGFTRKKMNKYLITNLLLQILFNFILLLEIFSNLIRKRFEMVSRIVEKIDDKSSPNAKVYWTKRWIWSEKITASTYYPHLHSRVIIEFKKKIDFWYFIGKHGSVAFIKIKIWINAISCFVFAFVCSHCNRFEKT